MKAKRNNCPWLLTGAILTASSLCVVPPAGAADSDCAPCHAGPYNAMAPPSLHTDLLCEECHPGTAAHLADPQDALLNPEVRFDQETCRDCHQDQYDTFSIVSRGRTYYGGSDSGPHPPKGWSKTSDLPYWNVLIDGHPFVLETYEDSPMAVNQIEHQETIRPGSEACLECHGTKVSFAMGIEYRDKEGIVHTIPAERTAVTLPDGTVTRVPAREYTLKNAHTIHVGTSSPAGQEWIEEVDTTVVPAGTKMWTYTDAVNLSGGPYRQPYQVKTLVTLPRPETATLADGSTVTFSTIASYQEAGADINGMDPDGEIAGLARAWIYAALEALAFDGLDYFFDDPAGETTFSGGGSNWPSIMSGELCNQCHDPHSGKLRIVRKALIAAIAERGINPYSATGSTIHEFEQASRQDRIIAVCAQCHSEYVGGYSAVTGLDQDYFPWAKPADLEAQYGNLFEYLQDWRHGGPVVPWQSEDANGRGFLPYGERFPIDAPLIKVQHPEAETFFDSPMYRAGATCTDCHSSRVTRPDGTRYTSHWFASPLLLMDGFSGETVTGRAMEVAPRNPCTKCHATDTIDQSRARIRDVQDQFFFVQERTQVALVNALKYINARQAAGADMSAEINTYRRASMRWEFYAQAENSMGFHNDGESTREVAGARLMVEDFIPWPLTPVKVRITSLETGALTLAFFDQADDETGFIIERAESLAGPYTPLADLPTPNGAGMGDVEWTDTGVRPGAVYYYRVAAYNEAGQSVYSIWADGRIPPLCLLPGDLTADGRVDLNDLLLFRENFGATGPDIPGDLDGDEVVGLADFAIFRQNYGNTCP